MTTKKTKTNKKSKKNKKIKKKAKADAKRVWTSKYIHTYGGLFGAIVVDDLLDVMEEEEEEEGEDFNLCEDKVAALLAANPPEDWGNKVWEWAENVDKELVKLAEEWK